MGCFRAVLVGFGVRVSSSCCFVPLCSALFSVCESSRHASVTNCAVYFADLWRPKPDGARAKSGIGGGGGNRGNCHHQCQWRSRPSAPRCPAPATHPPTGRLHDSLLSLCALSPLQIFPEPAALAQPQRSSLRHCSHPCPVFAPEHRCRDPLSLAQRALHPAAPGHPGSPRFAQKTTDQGALWAMARAAELGGGRGGSLYQRGRGADFRALWGENP